MVSDEGDRRRRRTPILSERDARAGLFDLLSGRGRSFEIYLLTLRPTRSVVGSGGGIAWEEHPDCVLPVRQVQDYFALVAVRANVGGSEVVKYQLLRACERHDFAICCLRCCWSRRRSALESTMCNDTRARVTAT